MIRAAKVALAATALYLLTGTPEAHWRLDATIPANDVATDRIVEVTASQQPRLRGPGFEVGARDRTRASDYPTWSGRSRFLVPAGTDLTEVSMGQGCGHGGCFRACKPPEDAAIAITKIDVVKTWTIETTIDETVTVSSDYYNAWTIGSADDIYVSSVKITPTGNSSVNGDLISFPSADVSRKEAVQATVKITGVCADAACAPPAAPDVHFVRRTN